MKITVEYEINNNGDCENCECRRLCEMNLQECIAFGEMLNYRSTEPIKQCKLCKEFLNKK